MADDNVRLTELEAAVRQTAEHYWRFQGRINALELLSMLGVLNLAKTQPNPFQWIQDYVEAMRVTTRTLTPDVDDRSKGDRAVAETKSALEELLEQLIAQAGQLKGAPGNPTK
jgi:hypothetical protein